MSDKKALFSDIQKKGAEPHKTPAEKPSSALEQAKLHGQIQKGVKLGHVAAPGAGISSGLKDAYLEDQREKKSDKKGAFVEKLDEKSMAVFNAARAKSSSNQAMFFLNAFWEEYGDQAEFIYACSNQVFRMSDMKSKGVQFVHLYDEGKDLDFDMGIYMFEQLCKFWDDPQHEWFRGSMFGLANWAAKHGEYKKAYAKSQPNMMTSIKRKQELKERVDVNFDGRVSFLEYLLYQYGASPKSLIERSMGNDLPEELRQALAALAEVQKRVNEYEAEKARLEEESKQPGVRGLTAKNMLHQLNSSPLWENINKALITAEAKVRIAQRKFGVGGTAVGDGSPMRNNGTLWWMERELQEKKEKYGKRN